MNKVAEHSRGVHVCSSSQVSTASILRVRFLRFCPRLASCYEALLTCVSMAMFNVVRGVGVSTASCNNGSPTGAYSMRHRWGDGLRDISQPLAAKWVPDCFRIAASTRVLVADVHGLCKDPTQ